LLGVLVKNIAKVVPPTLGDENGVAKVALHLADCNVTTLGVFLTGEKEILVLSQS